MSLSHLFSALGLVLVLEGILPLAAPRVWRDTLSKMMAMTDGQMRFVGLAFMLAGLLVVYLTQ